MSNNGTSLERLFFGAIAFLLLAFFIWINIAVVLRGVSSADDAFFALAAKTLADGRGYGIPNSNGQIQFFSPTITTGPTLVLPVALAIRVFGNVDWLPGAVTLSIFLLQIAIAASVLWEGFGSARTAAFMTVLIVLLLLVSTHNWYFGSMLGETPALGFLLIGTSLLAVSSTRAAILSAAVCLTLAALTKQIALFAVVGVLVVWLICAVWRGKPLSQIARDVAMIALVGFVLILSLELVKLVVLGWQHYAEDWQSTIQFNSTNAFGMDVQSSRLQIFTKTFDTAYGPPLVTASAIVASVLFFQFLRSSCKEKRDTAANFALLAWGGTVTYLAYVLFVSSLRQRYFWIGVALGCCAVAAPILCMEVRARLLTIASVFLLTALHGWYHPLDQVRRWAANNTAPQERSAVVRLLDGTPSLSFAADWWSSIFDVVYLKRGQSLWVYGRSVERLRGQPFIGIINQSFTNKSGRFYLAVTTSCELLTPGAMIIIAYRCDKSFWNAYGAEGLLDQNNGLRN